jgi:hypothetical protein
MVATIVLNQTNVVNDGLNNKLVYNFPNSVAFPHHEIAIQSIYMYYSWVNINGVSLNNNFFQYIWPTSLTTFTDVTIPDGLYEIATLNAYLQYIFIKAGQYLISSTGSNVYYMEFVVNPTRYGIQLNVYPVPTSLPSGWSVPVANAATGAAAWPGFPASSKTPSFQLSKGNLYKLFGFQQNLLFPTAPSSINASYISITAPQVQPNPSVFLQVTGIENNLATPSSNIGVVSPQVGFGELIQEQPPQFAWNKLMPGTYNSLRLAFVGTNNSQIQILDPQMVITLVIRDRKDISVTDAVSSASGGK